MYLAPGYHIEMGAKQSKYITSDLRCAFWDARHMHKKHVYTSSF